MFKRSKTGPNGDGETAREELPFRGDSGAPSGRAAGSPTGVEGPGRHPAGAYRSVPAARPGLEVYRRNPDSPTAHATNKGELSPMPTESKKLIVGRDISLTGQISSCDRLIVEGRVEVELNDCHTIEIAETGTFKGAAEIESAEVSGHYEGSLTVRDHLLIHGTGHVSGTIRYGRVEIEKGGEINGDVRSLGAKAEKSGQREAAKAQSPTTGPTASAPAAAVGGSKG